MMQHKQEASESEGKGPLPASASYSPEVRIALLEKEIREHRAEIAALHKMIQNRTGWTITAILTAMMGLLAYLADAFFESMKR